jgi:hypothetical protein
MGDSSRKFDDSLSHRDVLLLYVDWFIESSCWLSFKLYALNISLMCLFENAIVLNCCLGGGGGSLFYVLLFSIISNLFL